MNKKEKENIENELIKLKSKHQGVTEEKVKWNLEKVTRIFSNLTLNLDLLKMKILNLERIFSKNRKL